MGEYKFFECFRSNHIGFGVRWELGEYCDFALSIAIPFFDIVLSFGLYDEAPLK